MSDRPRNFDVWFQAANTVYKKVPFQVVAEWTQGGRLAPTDQLRPAGTEQPWKPLAEFELLADYVPRPSPLPVAEDDGSPAPVPADEVEVGVVRRRRREEEDDDPDMIPLIDVSLVLLIFFMLVQAAGALSPVDVPEMKYATTPSKDADAVTLSIEKRSADEVTYSVRVGEQPPAAENAALPSPEAAIKALDGVLAGAVRPPEVRVACAKDLPNERVYELTRELKARQTKGQIAYFVAEVNERGKP